MRIRLFCGCVFWMVRIEKMVFGRCVVISDFSGLCLMVSVGVMWLIVCCVCVCVWDCFLWENRVVLVSIFLRLGVVLLSVVRFRVFWVRVKFVFESFLM